MIAFIWLNAHIHIDGAPIVYVGCTRLYVPLSACQANTAITHLCNPIKSQVCV